MNMWMWWWEGRGEGVWWWEECSPEGERLVKQCQALWVKIQRACDVQL